MQHACMRDDPLGQLCARFYDHDTFVVALALALPDVYGSHARDDVDTRCEPGIDEIRAYALGLLRRWKGRVNQNWLVVFLHLSEPFQRPVGPSSRWQRAIPAWQKAPRSSR